MDGKAATVIGETMQSAMIVSEEMNMGMCSQGMTGRGTGIEMQNGFGKLSFGSSLILPASKYPNRTHLIHQKTPANPVAQSDGEHIARLFGMPRPSIL